MKRQVKPAYRLCGECPKPPSADAKYVINCRKHNHELFE
jgi:hypothetical protein